MADKISTSRKFNKIYSNQWNKKKPEISTDDTTITLAESENRLNPYLDLNDSRKHKQNFKTKKDANLLKNGRLKLSYERLKQSKNYFDEIELRKKRLINNKINKQNISPIVGQIKRPEERIQHSSYCDKCNPDPSTENYITDAEINTRGYIDRNGQIHYSIPILPITKESKEIKKKIGHVIISSNNSEQSIHNHTSNSSKSELGRRHGNIIGVVTCPVGDKDDYGRLDYQVYDDGRIYDLKCSDGRSMVLSFSKKDSALVTNWRRNDDSSFP